MTQGAAEQFSRVLMCGVCEGRDVSGQSMLDPDSQNKLVHAGGTDQEKWLLFCARSDACSWGTALVTHYFFPPSYHHRMVQSISVSNNNP